MPALTKRQSQILEFIHQRIRDNGYAPSIREITEAFRFRSPTTVRSHLALLEKKGALTRAKGIARGLTAHHPRQPVSPSLREVAILPLLGTISAGLPNSDESSSERCVAVDLETLQLPKNARTFALEVHGDSMIQAAILDRDVVIMELAEPKNRDIVAALIDGETTLKRYVVQRGRPFLRAENPKYPDLIPAQELVIQGVFRALIRIPRPRR